MPLLSVVNFSKSFGPDDLFEELSFGIPHRGRIGLVGANGVGKSTLLRILVGEDEASGGSVHHARNCVIGYLPQEATLQSERTLWDEVLTVYKPMLAMQEELHQLEARLGDGNASEELLAQYGSMQAKFDHLGGYTFETQIRMTLTGLGFSCQDEKRPVSQLSGGQRTRAMLAKLLLSKPDLLLLDEPTNHLDIEAVEWLENYFKDWPGGVLIVSHDRYFLDQVVNTVWEMTPQLEEYRGNYSAYMLQRQERYERRLSEYQAQQEFIEKEEEYIRRNIAGQNTRQAQGRRKRLERMLEEAKLTPPTQKRALHLNLKTADRSGDLVLRTRSLQVGYADEGKPLFEVPDLTLVRNECAAIIGPNGAGKTTFLKTLLEKIPPFAGEAVLGASLQIGYFAQAHEGLHADWTLMDEIQNVAPKMLPAEVRDYLAKFLFTGDDVFKTVSLLSGGERGRLALACLALQGSNLLLLDEPTNHLDLPSQEILQSVLADYRGTILLVSHDRYLIDGLATQIWEVDPNSQTLSSFKGTYSEYKTYKQQLNQPYVTEAPKAAAREKKDKPSMSKGERQKLENSIRMIEEKISWLENELKCLEEDLAVPPLDGGEVQRMGMNYTRLQAELEAHMEKWSDLHAALEE